MVFIPDAKKNQMSPENKQQIASKYVDLVCRDIRPFDKFGDQGFQGFFQDTRDKTRCVGF